jgi:hypothetical protein
MTRVAFAVLRCPGSLNSLVAQAPADAAVEKALLAAPENMKKDATVVAFKPDFTYDTIKKGTNTMVCLDRSGLPGQQPFSVECTSPRQLASCRPEPEVRGRSGSHQTPGGAGRGGKGRLAHQARVRVGVDPDAGEGQGHGSDPHDRAVPGATTQSTGLPDNPKQGGVWIMNAGTSTAHLMIPGH